VMEDTFSREELLPILGYIGLVRDKLRMQNWDVYLHRTVCDIEDTYAHTWQERNHFATNIELSRSVFSLPPVGVRNVVVHELVHSQHRDVNLIWEGCTQNNTDVPLSQAKSWDTDYWMHMERFVDWITRQIESSIPLYRPDFKYAIREGCYISEFVE